MKKKEIKLYRVKVTLQTEIVCALQHSEMPAEEAYNVLNKNLSEIVKQCDDPPIVTCRLLKDAADVPEGWDGGCLPWDLGRGRKPISDYFLD